MPVDPASSCPSPRCTTQASQPIGPLFGGSDATALRRLMAEQGNTAAISAVEGQLLGSASTEKLALALPSGWIAGVVVAGAVGLLCVAALMLRTRASGGLPL